MGGSESYHHVTHETRNVVVPPPQAQIDAEKKKVQEAQLAAERDRIELEEKQAAERKRLEDEQLRQAQEKERIWLENEKAKLAQETETLAVVQVQIAKHEDELQKMKTDVLEEITVSLVAEEAEIKNLLSKHTETMANIDNRIKQIESQWAQSIAEAAFIQEEKASPDSTANSGGWPATSILESKNSALDAQYQAARDQVLGVYEVPRKQLIANLDLEQTQRQAISSH